MKIGIIVHSHTGNTLSVAERLKDTLQESGHTVSLERVEAVNEDPNSREKLQLKTIPEISKYDAVILGAPVRAFNLSPVMKAYLAQIPEIRGMKICCFVTQHLKMKWMGGNSSIKQMKTALKQRGAEVICTGIVNWSGDKREDQINYIIMAMNASYTYNDADA